MFNRTNNAGTIPGLDGLRGISILFVIVSHLLWVPSFPWHWIASVLNPGDLGVRIFFVISGFLITTLLLREKERSGDISLKQFYFRRTLRIFPPYYFFLGVVFLAAGLRWLDLDSSDYWYTLTYTFNLKGRQGTWWVGHTWSLAVEEQFYLLWPLVVKLCSRRTIQMVALFWFAAGPIGRALFNLAPQAAIDHWAGAFPFVADPIAMGALLALWWLDPNHRAQLSAFARRGWFGLAPLAVVAIESLDHRPRFFPHPVIFSSVLLPFADLGIALVVAWAASGISSIFARFLNCRALVGIGVLSYSLYLWQMLFLNPSSTTIWLHFPLNIFWVAAAAVFSFTLIERPFNRLRHRRSILMQPRETLETVSAN